MPGKRQHSRTMRIDLIPDVAAMPAGDEHEQVVMGPSSVSEVRVPSPPIESDPNASHYERLLQRLYDAAIIADLSGNITDVNLRAEEFLRCSKDVLRGMTVFDVISGADQPLIDTLVQNLENERFTLIHAHCVRHDHSLFPAEIAVSRIDIGTVRLCFFIRDITIRKQAEEMLITEHNALQNSGDGIAVVGLDGALEYANPTMEHMWLINEQGGLIGRDLRDLFVERDGMAFMVHELLRGESSRWTQDFRARREDGAEFDVRVSGTRNRNVEGETLGCVFSISDIGDRKRAEEAERELERRRVMLESLGAACHHLGQPATMLLGNLELLRERLQAAEPETRRLVQGGLDAMDQLTSVLRKLTGVTEYKTTEYLKAAQDDLSSGSRILEI
jgi:PAS domain S-box-containing protein